MAADGNLQKHLTEPAERNAKPKDPDSRDLSPLPMPARAGQP